MCVCVFGLYMLQPTFIADFDQVQSVLTHATGIGSDVKHQVQIRIAGALEPLTITCASADLSKHLASLVDGYCRLVSGDSKSAVWKRTGVQLKLIVTYRVPTPPGKSSIFFLDNSRTWKVLENHFGPGKSWKISLEVMHFSSGSNGKQAAIV